MQEIEGWLSGQLAQVQASPKEPIFESVMPVEQELNAANPGETSFDLDEGPQDLPSEAMDTLIYAGKRKLFKACEAVFTEGAPADSCCFIAQGRASAVQNGKKINEMGAGDAFSEIAMLKIGSRRTASVVADSDLLCMELDIESFSSLLAALIWTLAV